MTKRRKNRQLRFNVYRGSTEQGLAPGELLLEYFSDKQLLAWRAHGKDIQAYHYLWFFELERQRATYQRPLIEALNAVPGIEFDLADWGRAMAYKHSNKPLSCAGAGRVRGRALFLDDHGQAQPRAVPPAVQELELNRAGKGTAD